MAKKPETANAEFRPDPRTRVVDALMGLASERAWESITLDEIATSAGLTLADLRDLFPSKGAMLGGFIRRIDRIVLEGAAASAELPARERLEDLIMRRFAALQPYRAPLRSIHAAFAHDIMGLAALNSQALNSWRYLLASIGIEGDGALGYAKLQGTILVFGKAFSTFLTDDSEGLAITRAEISRELSRAEWLLRRAEGVGELFSPLKGFFSALRETRNRNRANNYEI